MRVFRFWNWKEYHKWIIQNKAVAVDCAEGCLLDNLLCDCKNGIAFLFETYLSANSSDYTVYFFRKDEEETEEYEECMKRFCALQDCME